MNVYENKAPRTYNRMASITLLDYKKLLVEKDVANSLLESLGDEYERLIEDIKSGKPFKIEGREFEANEIVAMDK